tara:strand:+ start:49253 stop:49408 length:156 start_codon:yes stop_codon:yes gene_type:complete
MTHRPKGRMCAGCIRRERDCSALPFAQMRPIGKDQDGTIIVKCEWHEPRQQ